MKPLIIPVFIPHHGCPHECIFCNQRAISGEENVPPSEQKVQEIIHTWLSRFQGAKDERQDIEVAFYGGSFTALPFKRQAQLLSYVSPFLQTGEVKRIRLSTRPDYITPIILEQLKSYQVEIIELGVQSLDDTVLSRAARGHQKEDVVKGVTLLREHGFKVGLQLMIGLPGQSCLSVRKTVKGIASLQPDFVRIYPVVVVAGSPLEQKYQENKYKPLSLQGAVTQAAFMKKQFDTFGLEVVRMGLQAGESLEKAIVAGPFHPAFGEMVHARLMLQQTKRVLSQQKDGTEVGLVINPKDSSIFRGVGSANMYKLSESGLLDSFSLATDVNVPRFTIRVRKHDI